MRKLMIDLETQSDVDITKTGVYRYADSPYFDILLFAYSVDDAHVQVIDLACGEQIPEEILYPVYPHPQAGCTGGYCGSHKRQADSDRLLVQPRT